MNDHSADEAAVRAFLAESGAEWRVAACPAADVARLREMDHHVVTVDGRAAVLLAYHLWAAGPADAARVFVLFRYAERHPRAPADVQAIVDGLTFR
jgi:hypothetical protein